MKIENYALTSNTLTVFYSFEDQEAEIEDTSDAQMARFKASEFKGFLHDKEVDWDSLDTMQKNELVHEFVNDQICIAA